MTTVKRFLIGAAAGFGLLLASTAPASAQDAGKQVLQADLTEQNDSGAAATATVTLQSGEMTVEITGSGFTPGESPHAQHIHGVVGQDATCPTAAQDGDGDGIVTTSEGQATYGPILVSLTTEGGMDAKTDALAVDRMPKADAAGNLSYSRTFPVPANVGDDIDALHIVQHGVDFDQSGAYDGDRKSDLDPTLPAEATDPADCGELVAMPNGGVQTGGGAMAGHDMSTHSEDSGGIPAVAYLGATVAGLAVVGRFALRRPRPERQMRSRSSGPRRRLWAVLATAAWLVTGCADDGTEGGRAVARPPSSRFHGDLHDRSGHHPPAPVATSEAPTPAASPQGTPATVAIPSIGVEAPVVDLARAADGTLEVPGWDDAGWWGSRTRTGRTAAPPSSSATSTRRRDRRCSTAFPTYEPERGGRRARQRRRRPLPRRPDHAIRQGCLSHARRLRTHQRIRAPTDHLRRRVRPLDGALRRQPGGVRNRDLTLVTLGDGVP